VSVSNKLKVIYAGTPEFAVPALDALVQTGCEVVAVYTQPDRPSGRGHKLKASAVKERALALHLPVFQPESLKSQEVQDQLKTHAADLMIVSAYGLLLPPAVLEIPRLGCINVHASLLPRFRGAAPIARAIIAGDAETGVSIMQMDAGLDTGPVWLMKHCPITNYDTSFSLTNTLSTLGAEALREALPCILKQAYAPKPQVESQAVLAPKIQKQDASIDWSLPAVEIERMIRAFNPWPVAYANWKGEVLRIWEAEILVLNEINALPGTVISVQPEGLDVMTGKDCLRIKCLQRPGSKPVAIEDVINGYPNFFIKEERFR